MPKQAEWKPVAKAQIKRDAETLGVWGVFKVRREALKKAGMDVDAAWQEAARLVVYRRGVMSDEPYPADLDGSPDGSGNVEGGPQCGQPLETEQSDAVEAERTEAAEPAATSAEEGADASRPEAGVVPGPELGRENATPGVLGVNLSESQPASLPSPVVLRPQVYVPNPQKLRAAPRKSGPKKYIQPGPEDERSAWTAEMIESAKAQAPDLMEAIQWTLQMLSVPQSMLTIHDAPSPTAYHLWQEYSQDPDSRKQFFEKFVPKILPTKIEDTGSTMKDDGRQQISLADKLLAEQQSEKIGFHPHTEKAQ